MGLLNVGLFGGRTAPPLVEQVKTRNGFVYRGILQVESREEVLLTLRFGVGIEEQSRGKCSLDMCHAVLVRSQE